MTQTIATNEDNDIFIAPDGNLSMLSGQAAVEGACATAAKAQLAEMIYEANRGIPNFQTVWVGVPNPAIFESYLRTTLAAVDGVANVVSISVQVANNALKYAAVIESIFGKEFTLNG